MLKRDRLMPMATVMIAVPDRGWNEAATDPERP